MKREWIDENHRIRRYHLHRNSETKQDGNRAKFTLEYRKVGWWKERERERFSYGKEWHLLRSLLNAMFYIRLIPSGFTPKPLANSNSTGFLLSRNFKFTILRVKILLTYDETIVRSSFSCVSGDYLHISFFVIETRAFFVCRPKYFCDAAFISIMPFALVGFIDTTANLSTLFLMGNIYHNLFA